MAFLVTHNSFSHSPNIAVWARNQRFSVSQQLKDGVRGLMLDIYPGKLNKRPYFVLKALVRLNYGIYSTCLTLTSTKLQ